LWLCCRHNEYLYRHFDVSLVVLSIIIAFITFHSLELSWASHSRSRGVQKLWLVGGAIAMGVGIWSLYWDASLSLPIPMAYDIPTVLISMVAAILASGLALFLVRRQQMGCSWCLETFSWD